MKLQALRHKRIKQHVMCHPRRVQQCVCFCALWLCLGLAAAEPRRWSAPTGAPVPRLSANSTADDGSLPTSPSGRLRCARRELSQVGEDGVDRTGTLIQTIEDANSLAASGQQDIYMWIDPARVSYALNEGQFFLVPPNVSVTVACNGVSLIACSTCSLIVYLREDAQLRLIRCNIVAPYVLLQQFFTGPFGSHVLNDTQAAARESPASQRRRRALAQGPNRPAAARAGSESAVGQRRRRALAQAPPGPAAASPPNGIQGSFFEGRGVLNLDHCTYELTCTLLGTMRSLFSSIPAFNDNLKVLNDSAISVLGQIAAGAQGTLIYDTVLFCRQNGTITNDTTSSSRRKGRRTTVIVATVVTLGGAAVLVAIAAAFVLQRRSTLMRKNSDATTIVAVSAASFQRGRVGVGIADWRDNSLFTESHGDSEQPQFVHSNTTSTGTSGGASMSPSGGGPERFIAEAIQNMRTSLGQMNRDPSAERLQIHAVIAQGGFGTVYTGTWRYLPVAVKTVLLQGVEAGNESVQRAVAEASIAYSLCHPNIVSTYSHELTSLETSAKGSIVELQAWKLYLIQELCNGGTLRQLMQAGELAGPLKVVRLNRALPLLLDVARGMDHVHSKRIAHGDLNPNNILLHCPRRTEAFGEGGWLAVAKRSGQSIDEGDCVAKVADFGLSMHMNMDISHVSNVNKGTPFYCAPELMEEKRLLPASDVFSFGVVLWEVLHVCVSFCLVNGEYKRHPLFGEFAPHIPLTLSQLGKECLDPDYAKRPTFSQVVSLLLAVHGELQTGTYLDSKERLKPSSNVGYAQPEEAEEEDVPEGLPPGQSAS